MKKKSNNNNKTISIIIILFCLIYILAFIFTDKMGVIGKIIVQIAISNIGLGAYIFPFLLLSYSFIIFFDYKLLNPYHKLFGFSFLFIIFLVFIHIKILLLDNPYLLAVNGAGGGLIGYYLAKALYLYFGVKGTYLVLISLSLITALFITEISYLYLFSGLTIKAKILLNNLVNIIKNKKLISIMLPTRQKEITDYHEYTAGQELFKTRRGKRREKKIIEEIAVDQGLQETLPSEYQIPPLSLLSDPHLEDKNSFRLNIEENIKILENTFNNLIIVS